MRGNRPIRLIRKSESQTNPEPARGQIRPEPTEREIKTVVSRWVRDHRQRSEEFRRSFAALWQAGELSLKS